MYIFKAGGVKQAIIFVVNTHLFTSYVILVCPFAMRYESSREGNIINFKFWDICILSANMQICNGYKLFNA